MNNSKLARIFVFALAALLIGGASWSAARTWTDVSGKFSVTAEYVGVQGGKVVLRNADGKEISVPLKKLSETDREFVATQMKQAQIKDAPQLEEETAPAKQKPQREVVMKIAESFYADLRSKERAAAGKLLTDEAQALIKTGKSPLVYLPRPEASGKAIRVGRPKFDGSVAEIPVRVQAGEQHHQTWLHLRLAESASEGDQDWRIFALSAVYPDGEKSLDFEASVVLAGQEDPLKKLVGKPFLLEGYTLDGEPISSDAYKGKIVLVDFWATWCGPCRAEIPNILDNWTKYHDAGFEVLAVSVDKDLEALASFTGKENPPWTVLADRHPYNKKSMGSKFGIRSIPAFILLGRDGRVAAIHCRGKRLGEEVERLLAGG